MSLSIGLEVRKATERNFSSPLGRKKKHIGSIYRDLGVIYFALA
uniref:Uncharacterized protein n=1 Tax=Rhizophora mucronata TaxID=61149 RepID=A0A2P2J1D5_RHIMU